MPAEITFPDAGLPFRDLESINVQEDATPIEPSSSFGGVGQIATQLRNFEDAELLSGTIGVSDGTRGKTSGVIRTINVVDESLSITADSTLSLFNADYTVPPYVGTFQGAMYFYANLVGITNNVSVDASMATRPVVYPGWSGNVWVGIKQILVKEQAEMALVFDRVLIRPLRGTVAQIDRSTSITRTIDNTNAARAIDISYYNNVYGEDIEVYPLSYEEDDKARIYQVDAGETLVVTERLNASLSSVNQPIPLAFVEDESYAGSQGVYSVVGNDSLPVQPSQWTAQGGSLTVALTDDPSVIEITIVGASMKDYAPYRIAMSSGSGNDYNSLHITGEGIKFDKKTIRIPTGASNVTTSEEVGATIENPFINTLAEAHSLGIKAAQAYAGIGHTISGSGLDLNREGGSDTLVTYSVADFNDDVGEGTTISAFNIVWASTSIAAFNTVQQAKMDGLFENQMYGNIVGSRILDTYANFRVNSVTATPAEVQYSASADTLLDDFNDKWPNEDTLRTNLVTNPRHVPTTAYSVFSTNLCLNPSFEYNTSYWQQNLASVLTRVTTEKHSGVASLKVDVTALNQGTSTPLSSTEVPPAGAVTVSAWVKAPAGVNLVIKAEEYTPGSALVASIHAPFTGTGDWERVSATREGVTAGNKVRPAIVTSIAQTTTFYVDDVMIEASPVMTEFYNGDSVDTADDVYAWTSTIHASTSTRSVRKASAGWAYLSTGPVALTVDGERAMRALTNHGVGMRHMAYELANRQYTFGTPVSSVWRVTNDSPTTALTLRSSLVTYTQASSTLYSTHGDVVTVLPGQTMDIPVENKVLDGTDVWGYRAFLYATNAWVAGDGIRIHRVSVMDGTASGEPVRTNLVPNPSFEVGTAGWAAYSATSLVRSTTRSYSGVASGLVTSNGVGTYSGLDGYVHALPPGTYTLSAWVYLPAAYGTGVQARVIGPHGQTFGAVSTVIGAWTRVSHTYTTTTTGSHRLFICTYSSVPVAGATFHVDAVMLEESPTLDAYFDGSYFGCAWTGAADASPSTQSTLNPAVLSPYFDGSTPDADGTFYDWASAENNSTSTETYLSQSIARFNTEYAGYTCRDFSIKPLRRI